MKTILDQLKPTIYSLDKIRGDTLIHQLIYPPNRLNFRLSGRGVYFISDRCTFTCDYCKGIPRSITPPSLDEFTAVVQEWRARGVRYIHLTGLEPTLAPAVKRLVRIAGENSIAISMSTNGYQDFSLYRTLVAHGLKYLFISLDGHNDTLTHTISGRKDIYRRVSQTVKRMVRLKSSYDIHVVICLTVSASNFYELVDIVSHFVEELHPDDIRLIPAAQAVFSQKDKAYFTETIYPQLKRMAQGKYPFLAYRLGHFFDVRGLFNHPARKCYIVLDEQTIGGPHIYPCNIYIRERGQPICEYRDSEKNQKIWQWFRTQNVMDDPICAANCCDVTRDFNLMIHQTVEALRSVDHFNVRHMVK